MGILIGIILGALYAVQPIEPLKAPVEGVSNLLVQYTGQGVDWLMGVIVGNGFTIPPLITLIVAAATPSIAGLALNMIVPLSGLLRSLMGLGLFVMSTGSFFVLEMHEAIALSVLAGVAGVLLTFLSGPIMEAIVGFFSVTLGVQQVMSLLTGSPNTALAEIQRLVIGYGVDPQFSHWVSVGAAAIPLVMLVLWLLSRLGAGKE